MRVRGSRPRKPSHLTGVMPRASQGRGRRGYARSARLLKSVNVFFSPEPLTRDAAGVRDGWRCPMNPIEMLRDLRAHGGQVRTRGLDDATIERFAASDASLAGAIADAREAYAQLRETMGDFLALDEPAQIERAQSGFVNFYA